eukprot:gene24261-31540_t
MRIHFKCDVGPFASVVSIGSFAFAYCRKLSKVVILPTVIDIGSNAFFDNSALTRIDATSDVCVKVLNSCRGTCYQFRGCPIPSSAPTIAPSTLPPSSRSPSLLITQSPSISIDAVTCSSCYQCSIISSYYYFTAVIPSGEMVVVASAFSSCITLTAIIIPT